MTAPHKPKTEAEVIAEQRQLAWDKIPGYSSWKGNFDSGFDESWARCLRHSPTVLALMDSLRELVDILEDRDARREVDSFTNQLGKAALKQYEEEIRE